MARHLLIRALIGVSVMWGVVTLMFLLLRVAPGDPARLLLGPTATPEQVEEQRRQLGLDRPVAAQYARWLSRLARGDLGTSIATGRPVRAMLAEAWPATALLVSLSLLLSYVLGILLALVQASVSGSRTDTSLSVASVTLFAMPGYWLGVVLVLVFAYWLRVLPAFGAAGLDAEFLSPLGRVGDRLRHLALPLATLTLIGIGGTRATCAGRCSISRAAVPRRGAGEGALRAIGARAPRAAQRADPGGHAAGAFAAGALLGCGVRGGDLRVAGGGTGAGGGGAGAGLPGGDGRDDDQRGAGGAGDLVADGLVVLADPRLREETRG